MIFQKALSIFSQLSKTVFPIPRKCSQYSQKWVPHLAPVLLLALSIQRGLQTSFRGFFLMRQFSDRCNWLLSTTQVFCLDAHGKVRGFAQWLRGHVHYPRLPNPAMFITIQYASCNQAFSIFSELRLGFPG